MVYFDWGCKGRGLHRSFQIFLIFLRNILCVVIPTVPNMISTLWYSIIYNKTTSHNFFWGRMPLLIRISPFWAGHALQASKASLLSNTSLAALDCSVHGPGWLYRVRSGVTLFSMAELFLLCRTIVLWRGGSLRERTPAVRGTKKSPVKVIDRASKNLAATYSPALWCSTIGHEGLNFSVRYGKRWTPSAKPP